MDRGEASDVGLKNPREINDLGGGLTSLPIRV